MTPKVIKTESDYDEALRRVAGLMRARAGTPQATELELLSTLIDAYERDHHAIDLPDPIEAIKFRMEQDGLKPQDLVPFIGSRSKVSEVLNGQRPLSLRMIRALHAGLEIPAAVLLRDPAGEIPDDPPAEQIDRFPVAEMAKRGWFEGFAGKARDARERQEELVRGLLVPLREHCPSVMLTRLRIRSGSQMDKYALVAWHARVIQLAMQEPVAPYRPGTVTEDFVRHLASFSFVETGPRLAGEFLAKSGVRLVVVRHLPRTHLDGAAMMTMSGMPVVALTLRHDRLDNFWFTLCHELGHIALHFASGNTDSFIDDFDDSGALEQVESEADTFAADSLILPEVWRESAIAQHPTPEAVRALAESLRVHSAIVAGRIRRDVGNYRILSNLVGAGSVRRQFPGRESGVNVGSAIGYSA